MNELRSSNSQYYERIPLTLWETFEPHLSGKETPYLIIDIKTVQQKYIELHNLIPEARIHYAVKANPAKEVLRTLAQLDSCFDVASPNELNKVLEIGVGPDRISYGNTIKKEKDIEYAFRKGIKTFACDSEAELKKQAKAAPGSKVFFRISTDGSGSDWPLSKKFGSHPDMVYSLAIKAQKIGLIPYGISFHVGSQQRDIGQWDNAVGQCHYLFSALKQKGIELKMINLGGGFPCNYLQPTQNISTYIDEIKRYLRDHFGDNIPALVLEPGRAIVGDAGMIVSEIILISKKSKTDLIDWVYIDVGLFGGMIECLNESIKYPLFTQKNGRLKKVILAGPTCDSMDILYQEYMYNLPERTQIGDKLYFFATGAYTSSYSSVEFNGFTPLKSYFIN